MTGNYWLDISVHYSRLCHLEEANTLMTRYTVLTFQLQDALGDFYGWRLCHCLGLPEF